MPIDAQWISTAGSSFAEGLTAFQTLSRPAFSPDGTFVAYVALLDEGPRKVPVVQILETKRGSKVHDFQPHVCFRDAWASFLSHLVCIWQSCVAPHAQ